MSALTEALAGLAAGRDLTAAEVHAAVSAIMAGDASEAAIAAFLTALRMKGESAEEVAGAVEAVRERAQAWEDVGLASPLLDTCGTGGDGANTVNVSTATAIVVASCGVPVAKHGNRSASGNSGSAEVLAELGIAIEAEPLALRRCLAELGLTFLFAPGSTPPCGSRRPSAGSCRSGRSSTCSGRWSTPPVPSSSWSASRGRGRPT